MYLARCNKCDKEFKVCFEPYENADGWSVIHNQWGKIYSRCDGEIRVIKEEIRIMGGIFTKRAKEIAEKLNLYINPANVEVEQPTIDNTLFTKDSTTGKWQLSADEIEIVSGKRINFKYKGEVVVFYETELELGGVYQGSTTSILHNLKIKLEVQK